MFHEDGTEVKGGAEDHPEHAGERRDVRDDDEQRHEHIEDAHDGDKHKSFPDAFRAISIRTGREKRK